MLESTAGLQKVKMNWTIINNLSYYYSQDEDKRISQKKPVQDHTRPNRAINSWGEDSFAPTVPTVK